MKFNPIASSFFTSLAFCSAAILPAILQTPAAKAIVSASFIIVRLQEARAASSLDSLKAKEILTSTLEASQKASNPVVVVFLSMKCPNSQAHLKWLSEQAFKFPDFRFVGVHSNQDESSEEAQKYFKKSGLPFLVVDDSKGTIADLLKAFKTPHAFVIGADGKVLYGGGLTNSARPESANEFFLQEALQDLSAGRNVRRAEGRTLGCIISRDRKSEFWQSSAELKK